MSNDESFGMQVEEPRAHDHSVRNALLFSLAVITVIA